MKRSLPQETVSTSQQEYEKWSADRQAQNLKHLRMLHKVATAVPPKARQKATTVPLVARQEAAAVPLRGIPRAMANQIPSTNPYAYPHDSSLSPNTTALLIIDMQRDFLSPGGYLSAQNYTLTRFQALIPRLVSLLSTFRRANFPIYHTREGHSPHLATVSSRELHRSSVNGAPVGSQGPLGKLLVRGERGHDIISELQPLPREPVIDKPGRGAFTHTELEASLRAKGVRNLVVCGVTADACVSSTVREASDRGFDVLVVEDGVESVSEELKWWSLESIRVEGGLFGVTGTCREVVEAVESWVNVEQR